MYLGLQVYLGLPGFQERWDLLVLLVILVLLGVLEVQVQQE